MQLIAAIVFGLACLAHSACALVASVSRRIRSRFAAMSHAQPQVVGSEAYLLLSNLQSGSNIGSICRNALAFNVSEVVIVGRKELKMRQADRGARSRLRFSYFVSLAEAAAYLRTERQCSIVGIEICAEAVSLMTFPFEQARNYAFVFGNEGR